MVTHTVGDPDRGADIAQAVLDDDAARAEIVEPITNSVMGSTGLPAEQQPFVAAQVDRLLQDPAGAQAFIDPFAGKWARMLGADDLRPSQFDVTPFIDDIVATTPGLDAASLPTDQFAVPSVPLPSSELSGLGRVRGLIAASTMPLTVAAVVGFAFALAFGDRRWVLRRAGLWAVFAGAGWVIVPIVIVWAARRWATGADAVVAIAVEEAVSGLRPTALVLLVCGIAAFAGSFALALAPSRAEPERHRPAPEPRPQPVQRRPAARPAARQVERPAAATRTMPDHVVVQPATPAPPLPPDDDVDPLWKYYS